MDDVVRAAVQAAMAHEARLGGAGDAATATGEETRPAASGMDALTPSNRGHVQKRAKRFVSSSEAATQRPKSQPVCAKATKAGTVAPTSAVSSGLIDGTSAHEKLSSSSPVGGPPLEKQSAAKKKSSGKKLSSNWAALRSTLQKPASGVTKRRPRRVAPPASTVPATPSPPLNCSMFVKTALRSGPSVKPTKVVALDCEFVGIGPDGREDALARASVVNSRGEVLYDSFVRVEAPVVDYRTQFSGVLPENLTGPDADDPRTARSEIANILKGRVLVGHAVHNDLRVLRIAHPRRDTRDTSDYYKQLWRKNGRRGSAPPALRLVVARVLGVDEFQRAGHDSCEDARASLALYKKNAKEWESSLGKSKAAKSKR